MQCHPKNIAMLLYIVVHNPITNKWIHYWRFTTNSHETVSHMVVPADFKKSLKCIDAIY